MSGGSARWSISWIARHFGELALLRDVPPAPRLASPPCQPNSAAVSRGYSYWLVNRFADAEA